MIYIIYISAATMVVNLKTVSKDQRETFSVLNLV